MARGGLPLATGAGSFDAEARAASQGYMAACNRRRVLQIRRQEFPTFFGWSGQWSTLTPRTDTSPKPHGRRESRSTARTAAGIALTLLQ
jgi:hypothetical protein